MGGAEYGLFDGGDGGALVQRGFASYAEAEAMCAGLIADGEYMLYAAQCCDKHPHWPAAGCEACEVEDDEQTSDADDQDEGEQ
jgi:hypothetical protein